MSCVVKNSRLKLICQGHEIHLQIDGNEKAAMLVVGGSRMGKTYFLSFLGAELIHQGAQVHLIDLGDKWSSEDKERLRRAGATILNVEKEKIVLSFATVGEMLGSADHIVNALGMESMYAKTYIRNALKAVYDSRKGDFSFSEFLEYIRKPEDEKPEYNEWRMKICDCFETCEAIPSITFHITNEWEIFIKENIIWDLAGLNGTYTQVVTYLVTYSLFCQKRNKFRNGDYYKTFVFIDEFQTLDCRRHSIIGQSLTEGQKYGLNLVLATQFLSSNFSEAVINQFKQGGFRFYFRLTEEEAAEVSRQFAFDPESRKEVCEKLARLPVGHCLMKGPNTVGRRKMVTENVRFLEVICEESSEIVNPDKSDKKPKRTVVPKYMKHIQR